MTITDTVETPQFDVASSQFLKAIVSQIRANDAYGTYRSWGDELLLKPYIVTKVQKREISIDGEVDPITKGRIMAFYRAIAYCIEAETGTISQVVIDLSHEGFGWALIFAGRLLLVARTLRDAQRFGFDSLEKAAAEGEKMVESGIAMARKYPDVCK